MLTVDDMEFVVYLTFRCNFHCNMCTQGEEFRTNEVEELSVDGWCKLFDSLTSKIEHPRIVFMGGEPLLHKDFDQIIIEAEKRGIEPHVITNGYLLDKHLDTILKTHTGLTISLHGLESVHNGIANVKNSFQKTVENLKTIRDLNKKGARIFCRVNSVILPENIDEARNFTEYLKQFNLTDLILNHPRFTSYEIEEKTLCRTKKAGLSSLQRLHLHTNCDYLFDKKYVEKVDEFFDFIKKEYKNRKVVEFPRFSKEERYQYYNEKDYEKIRQNRLCASPWNVPFILPNGDVATCLYSVVGNFTREDFWKIWNGERANDIRSELINNGNLPSCKRCTCFYDAHYIYAKDGILKLQNGQKIRLPKELTMLMPSSDGYFVWDIERKEENGAIPVIAMTFSDDKERKRIERCEKIIGKFSEIAD